ncbi:aldo/keto reductase family oxidoreductase [Shouchella sp. JSM 1781072]|uniref:aldo/keto reductase n=1 Tax=Bacillaceae TaxID=186817 RepID=UPI000C07437B|nr:MULTISPECIES: aldo/keto reductase [Bacillaceae]UTR07388.1 aldo/keto reductase [Alkalihalobacillus sp. LMS6]
MKTFVLPGTDLNVSNMILGNMRINGLDDASIQKLIQTAYEEGINFYDHADIYGGGECESLFAKALSHTDISREKIVLQSKCGIRKGTTGFYDFSKDHILTSVDAILQRLNTEYLDILLLHRPDPLMEPDEVAAAFQQLHDRGKVRHFGVSNHTPQQIELLQRSVDQKLIVNQVQYSLAHTPLIDSSMSLNMKTDESVNRDAGTLDYSRLNEITLQAWSPYQNGFFAGTFIGNHKEFPELNDVLERLAKQYNVTATAIATAWITRHPANIQVVVGSTKPSRVKEACAGSAIPLSREEWTELYAAAGNPIP